MRLLTTYAIAGADGLFIAKEVGGDSVDLIKLFDLHTRVVFESAVRLLQSEEELSAFNRLSWPTPPNCCMMHSEVALHFTHLVGRVASVKVSTCSPAASDEWASLYMALCLSIASRA